MMNTGSMKRAISCSKYKNMPLFRKTYKTPDPRRFPSDSLVHAGVSYGPDTALLGYTQAGDPLLLRVAAQPHVLIAGASGSGKSSLMHAIILSLAAVSGHTRPQFAFIDVKRVEFSLYTSARFPMALYPRPACDLSDIRSKLTDLSKIIGNRYKLMEKKNIALWNGQKIYIVIDELADLVIGHKDILADLVHICQIGRAAGVHVIAATQVPSRATIPTLLQVNMPAHIALRVSSPIESRIIIGDAAATDLCKPGDLILDTADGSRTIGHADYYTRNDIARVLASMTN